MERYFNDDQLDYMRDLAAHPDKVCACGWYWKEDCSRRCRDRKKRDAAPREEPT